MDGSCKDGKTPSNVADGSNEVKVDFHIGDVGVSWCSVALCGWGVDVYKICVQREGMYVYIYIYIYMCVYIYTHKQIDSSWKVSSSAAERAAKSHGLDIP